MPIIHRYLDGPNTPCGSPIAGGDPESSRAIDPVNCWLCLFALEPPVDPTAAYCDGGCPDCNEQPPAYVHGYADGKSKAHFEIRYRTADHDPKVCGCEPCITVRVVLARFGLWPPDLAATGDSDHPDYPGYKVCRGCRGPDDGHFPDCVVQVYEKRREATPEDDQRIGRWLAENALVIPPVLGCPENDGGEHIFSLNTAGLYCPACLEYLVKVA